MKAYLTALFMGAMCISLHGQEQRFKGYPSPTGEIDIEAHFARPPKGYGNVRSFGGTATHCASTASVTSSIC